MKNKIDGQINMFEMLGIDETPEIPFEQQKKGTRGYVIRVEGLFLKENGWEENMVGVTVRRMEIKEDSKTDRHGRWQNAFSIDHCKGDGWIGTPEKLYSRMPTWAECERYARRRYEKDPDMQDYKIIYLVKNGDATHSIRDYPV